MSSPLNERRFCLDGTRSFHESRRDPNAHGLTPDEIKSKFAPPTKQYPCQKCGKMSPTRGECHACFMKSNESTDLEEGVYDKYICKAIFMAGGGGSGKSAVAGQMFDIDGKSKMSLSGLGVKVVNSDSIFELLAAEPKVRAHFEFLKGLPKKVYDLKKEMSSSEVQDILRPYAKKLTGGRQELFLAGKLPLLIDGTGKNAGNLLAAKTKLEGLGYDCYMVYVKVDVEVALKRNLKRDRTVPPGELRTAHAQLNANLSTFKSAFGSNFAEVVNNDLDAAGWRKAGEDRRKVAQRWLNSAIQNQKGKDWVAAEKERKNILAKHNIRMESVTEGWNVNKNKIGPGNPGWDGEKGTCVSCDSKDVEVMDLGHGGKMCGDCNKNNAQKKESGSARSPKHPDFPFYQKLLNAQQSPAKQKELGLTQAQVHRALALMGNGMGKEDVLYALNKSKTEAKSSCRNCGCSCKPDDLRNGNCRKCDAEIELGDKVPKKDFSEAKTIRFKDYKGKVKTGTVSREEGDQIRVTVHQDDGTDYLRYINKSQVVESEEKPASGVVDVNQLRRDCNEIIRKEALDGERGEPIMEPGFVKTPQDEEDWGRAKKLAKKSSPDDYYALANHIFQNIKGAR